MIKYFKLTLFLLSLPLILALTVTDTVTKGRVVNGTLVSDADEEQEVPVFGDIQNSENGGNVTLSWSAVTSNENGDPITVLLYELRYKLTSATEYTVVTVPPNFVGHALTLTAGSYEAIVEAVDTNGNLSTASNTTFTVP